MPETRKIQESLIEERSGSKIRCDVERRPACRESVRRGWFRAAVS
jgi:hypothetical protein